MTFSDYHPTTESAAQVLSRCAKYAATFEARRKAGDSLLMSGNAGTGKNMLAAIICQVAAAQGFSVLHTTAAKMVRRIKESWGKGSGVTEQQAIDRFVLPDLLVVDEIGMQFGSETERLLQFEVFNGRYEESKPTIAISNLDEVGIGQYLGDRVIDRFRDGNGAILTFDWDSYRGPK